jgi:hypothetical protein
MLQRVNVSNFLLVNVYSYVTVYAGNTDNDV